MKTDLIEFHGNTLVVQDHEGEMWTAFPRLCEPIGLDVQAQSRRIKKSPWGRVAILATQTAEGVRHCQFIPVSIVPMWLATVRVSMVNEELRPTLSLYQQECADVLYKHAMRVPQSTGIDAADLAQSLNAISIACSKFTEVSETLAVLVKDFSSMHKHIERIEENQQVQRKNIKSGVKDLHVSFVSSRGGWCPCCNRVQVIRDGEKNSKGQFDHFFGRHMAGRDEVWLVCCDCNSKLRGHGEFWRNALQLFAGYQSALHLFSRGDQLGLFD